MTKVEQLLGRSLKCGSDITAAHAFELPPHSGAPAEAVDAAADDQAAYPDVDTQ